MRLFVENLSNIDFSYLHPSRGVVGETWLASVELDGDLDEQGMICDFGIVKAMIRKWLDDEIDHKLLIPSESDKLGMHVKNDEVNIEWLYGECKAKTTCPKDALAIVDCKSISESSVATWCIEKLKPKFPSSVNALNLTFQTEEISGPYYHYSHGLKKHNGNCQRIAHGHRSKIMIWRNGSLALSDMRDWAERWKDIYIGSEDDISHSTTEENIGFRYQAQQGNFSIELPKSQCYLLKSDSTVEFIASHIASELKKKYPSDSIRVKAFEGLAKGAIVDA